MVLSVLEANVAARRDAVGHRLEVVQVTAAAGVLERHALALKERRIVHGRSMRT